MRTVNQVSKISGVSIRTLHYYDEIGLLHPTTTTDAEYRLYDDVALERLQYILLFRELEFPLKDIAKILDSADFDREKALEQQIELLTLKKEHLEGLIKYAREIKKTGVKKMSFKAFDKKKIEEYAKEAKKAWGNTDAYKEFEVKSKNWTESDMNDKNKGLLDIFGEFGAIMNKPADGAEAQALVEKLRQYITANFYNCTPEILAGLGQMYVAGGEMTDNIDKMGGQGTANFANEAIKIYCK